MQPKSPVRSQIQNNCLLNITAQDIEHARTVLGVDPPRAGAAAGKQVLSPRPRKKAEAQQRRKSFACKLAANAFARWRVR
jgi:hypothetical protein